MKCFRHPDLPGPRRLPPRVETAKKETDTAGATGCTESKETDTAGAPGCADLKGKSRSVGRTKDPTQLGTKESCNGSTQEVGRPLRPQKCAKEV